MRLSGRIINTSAINYKDIGFYVSMAGVQDSFRISRVSSGNSTPFSVYLEGVTIEEPEPHGPGMTLFERFGDVRHYEVTLAKRYGDVRNIERLRILDRETTTLEAHFLLNGCTVEYDQ